MFTKRIIPCLDVKDGRVVKGVNFVDLRDAGDPVEIAAAYDAAGADEVVFLDITASSDQRGTVVDMVKRCGRESVHPLHSGRRYPHGGGFPAAASGGSGQDFGQFRGHRPAGTDFRGGG